ncbi:hypothetical protein [Haliscomenobacter sp.]|uniref:hypothetical protein n=1 Tax=Haliscomenobacter sp. TaxID=2717303 RepID=UPI003BADA241
MEEVDMEELKAYAAGTLSARERSAFERRCRAQGYDPQILVEILEFEKETRVPSSRFNENKAFEQLKSKLNK